MSTSPWTLDGSIARMEYGPWRAQLDLTRPGAGLTNVAGSAGPLGAENLFGPLPPGVDVEQSIRPTDVYLRADEVVAEYAATAERPVRATFAWRCHDLGWLDEPAVRASDGLMIELLVTLDTDEFAVPAETIVRSQLAAEQALRYTNIAGQPLEPIGVRDRIATLRPAEGALCVLLRGGGEQFSHAQMVHPHDRCTLRLERAVDSSAIVLRHDLFDWPLEKGVTLRARLRGVFLPAEQDEPATIAAYDELARQPPALTA